MKNKLEYLLQTFKEKIHQIVTERPDLFDGSDEDTSERLDRLITTLKNQAAQLNVLQTERNQIENEVKELQKYK